MKNRLKTLILKEEGYNEALLGMSLSYKDRAISLEEWWTDERKTKASSRAAKLAFMDGGHNKFLESIQLWVYVEAPRAFWSEFDTYRVGTSKQSESTMHTLLKRPVNGDDFEDGTHPSLINAFNEVLITKPGIKVVKMNLPEGYLQARIVNTNYKVLQNIIRQRWDHRLDLWESFCQNVLSQVKNPELLPNPFKERE